jgi:DNA-binding response OmpR family regulator
MTKILLVEDDVILCETLSYNLSREGYQLLTANDGLTGLDLARSGEPDLIILDLMLPGLDGLSICRYVRRDNDVPIMLLTARQDEADRIRGFEVGADDYVVKPFSLGELFARLRVMIRRRHREPHAVQHEVLRFGCLRVDMSSRRAFHAEQELILTQKEFDLLVCLMRNGDIVLTRERLLQEVWGDAYTGDVRTVDVHIRWLREKLEIDPSHPKYIQTVRGVGYRFDPPLAP